MQSLPLTMVAVTQASFPPALSGGEWQEKKEESILSVAQSEGWGARWGLGKLGGSEGGGGVHLGIRGLFAAQVGCSGFFPSCSPFTGV